MTFIGDWTQTVNTPVTQSVVASFVSCTQPERHCAAATSVVVCCVVKAKLSTFSFVQVSGAVCRQILFITCTTYALHYVALQQILSSKSFSFPIGLIPRTLGPSNDFTLLNGWIYLHGVLD